MRETEGGDSAIFREYNNARLLSPCVYVCARRNGLNWEQFVGRRRKGTPHGIHQVCIPHRQPFGQIHRSMAYKSNFDFLYIV